MKQILSTAAGRRKKTFVSEEVFTYQQLIDLEEVSQSDSSEHENLEFMCQSMFSPARIEAAAQIVDSLLNSMVNQLPTEGQRTCLARGNGLAGGNGLLASAGLATHISPPDNSFVNEIIQQATSEVEAAPVATPPVATPVVVRQSRIK